MRYTTLLLTVFAVGVLCGVEQTAFGQTQRVTAEASRISGDSFPVVTKTAKGANVYATRQPSSAMLKAIDQGLTDLFAVARKNRYFKRLNYSDYTVYIAKPDRSTNADGQYSPDIAIGSAQYAGTIFDKGGYIYVAGMVISNDPCAFLIGEHTKDFERVSNVVRYEGEHLVLYHNDRPRYEATKDHSKGGTHPILQ